MRDEEMRKQEELTRKQEAVRRKTLEYEAELRQQTELARVKAETEGKIRQERENHDLRLEEAREGAKEYRDTVLEGECGWPPSPPVRGSRVCRCFSFCRCVLDEIWGGEWGTGPFRWVLFRFTCCAFSLLFVGGSAWATGIWLYIRGTLRLREGEEFLSSYPHLGRCVLCRTALVFCVLCFLDPSSAHGCV